jgi:peptidoglycan-associated lipoprotein
MKRILFIGVTIILWNCSTTVKAQYVVNEADKQFELFNYIKAIHLYELAWKKKETLHTAERLTAANQAIQNYKEAESWSALAAQMPESSVANQLNYAKALQDNGKYGEAKQQYQLYAKLVPNTKQLNSWLLSCDSAMYWARNPKPIVLENERLMNSIQSDWGVTAYAGSMVFSSDRNHLGETSASGHRPFLKFDGTNLPDKKTYGWTGNGYFRLYRKDKTQDSIQLFQLPTATDYHIGAASFSIDGNEVYFTLTRVPKFSGGKNKLQTINVEIYSSRKDATGKWGAPVSFPYNKVEEYTVGDPFLAADGNTLYFSSSMLGGIGGIDLYACVRTPGGAWGKPVNLKEVNTVGNERTPIFDKDNHFYFSSDGRVGMGGLDIYRTVNGTKGAIENLGYPINSPQDDFAL